jgi:putative aldouronate transport system permease protein
MKKNELHRPHNRRTLASRMWEARYLYLLFIPVAAYFIIFHYYPMTGIIIAFKRYNVRLGFFGSPWIGLENYRFVFMDPRFYNALRNTFVISFSRVIFQFPMPIILGIMLSEVPSSSNCRRNCNKPYGLIRRCK